MTYHTHTLTYVLGMTLEEFPWMGLKIPFTGPLYEEG